MIEIDLSADIEQAERQLYRWEREIIPKAVSSALNKTRNNMQTAVNRHLSKTTGLKIKELKAAEFKINSTRYTLFATLTARRRPFNLRRFVTPGRLAVGAFARQQGVIANPWRKRRLFPRMFIIRGRTHDQLVVVKRVNKAGTKLKGVYGPSVNIEFNRPASRRLMRDTVIERFRVNFERDLNHFLSRARK